ncbi:DUF2934 domain-containing protein [Rhizobium sp. P38BS-XIX]|uniref:DUF2934 domain-containing protein n=1 Tax=Rhizobium sp. P38BS-XIX TaxID=2726740 RepID=UPI001456F3B7|nr:DUF2934 domain-containing protein [Rhizobium sp. P38BS-XIX]NLS01329.1 DUF2934 domain-containing protein [Rhizobium sp. P38BS-XIX]
MNDERFSWISKRAYALWEQAGRPWGRDEDHWNQAVSERNAMEGSRASSDGQELILRFKQKLKRSKRAQSPQANDEDEPVRSSCV